MITPSGFSPVWLVQPWLPPMPHARGLTAHDLHASEKSGFGTVRQRGSDMKLDDTAMTLPVPRDTRC